MVRGYQGTDLADNTTVMACVKHYALYGAVEGGRDYNIVNMGRQEALNGFLPPYRESAYEGAGSFMASFNDFEGIPAHINRYLLNDLLREEWGFKGFITSDYEGINECVNHGIGDIEEVTALAIEASVDMDLNGSAYMDNLENLVKQGRLSEKDIEVACRRVLEAKYKLGLFEDPYRYLNLQRYQREIHTDEARQLSREIARECQVLLKNEANVLPLSKSAKIALVGPFAVAAKEMQGSWSFSRFADGCVTFLEGMQEAVTGHGGSVTYAEGCWVLEDKQLEQDMVNQYLGAYKPGQVIKPVHTRPNEQLVAEAVALARRSDVVVAALGELNNMNGEGVSRSDITLGLPQVELLKALKATGKPVILILTAAGAHRDRTAGRCHTLYMVVGRPGRSCHGRCGLWRCQSECPSVHLFPAQRGSVPYLLQPQEHGTSASGWCSLFSLQQQLSRLHPRATLCFWARIELHDLRIQRRHTIKQ